MSADEHDGFDPQPQPQPEMSPAFDRPEPDRPSPGASNGRFQLALIAGAVTAAVCGTVWAGIAYYTGYEFGVVAWLIGGVIGGVMLGFGREQSVPLGVAAVIMIVGGLMVGKVLTVQWTTASIVEMLGGEEELMVFAAVSTEMEQEYDFSPEAARWIAETEYSEPSPEVQAEMDAFDAAVEDRIAGMSDAERAAAVENMGSLTGDMSLIEQVRMGLSGWDFLWIGLAVITGWNICARSEGAAA